MSNGMPKDSKRRQSILGDRWTSHPRATNGKPEDIQFNDIDRDGDLDLTATQHSKTCWDGIVDGEYIARNDGQGNFGKLELIGNQE